MDNGFYKRKNLKIIRYDGLPLADGIFAEAVSSSGYPELTSSVSWTVSLILNGFSFNQRP